MRVTVTRRAPMYTDRNVEKLAGFDAFAQGSSQKYGLDPMPNIVNPFILWPVGIAVGGFLFFEIAR